MPLPDQRKYLETRIKTAPPEELTIIIFDVLIQSASKAVDRMRNAPGDIQSIHNELRRSQQAVATLMGSLNFEIGGDLARSLFRMYEFWYHELVMANLQKSPGRVERLLPDFKAFRSTWSEANRRFREMQRGNGTEGKSQGGFAAIG
jgi:flagellar protein FliS